MEKNAEDREVLRRKNAVRIGDWITLPLAAIFFLIGAGILAGVIFRDNNFLQGATRIGIGLALTVYGLARLTMIIRRLRK